MGSIALRRAPLWPAAISPTRGEISLVIDTA